MTVRRTQSQRSAETRRALVDAARALFAGRGYTAVGTDDLARAAGVTRGALYHQFGGKEGLFEAVFEEVQAETADRVAADLAREVDPVAKVQVGVAAFLEACADPAMHQIVLLDAPVALGWERWREIGRRFGFGLVEGGLDELAAAGLLPADPTRPLAHLLMGALEEAALYVARSDDPAARTVVGEWLERLINGLLVRST
jgi:AcrR family transcriptional regulator